MKDYYKMGEIMKLYNIGRDSLKYYEKLGILNPKRDENGYRMYSVHDIWEINVIRELRILGFSMADIKNYFDYRSIETTMELLKKGEVLIDKEIEELLKYKKSMGQRILNILEVQKNINEKKPKIKIIPERKIFELKENILRTEDVDFMIKKLQRKHQEVLDILGNNRIAGILSMDKILEGIYGVFTAIICILDDEALQWDKTLPSGKYLVQNHQGDYYEILEVIKEMVDFANKKGLKIISDPMEIYRIDIHETNDPKEFFTEIQMLVE